MPWPPFLPPCWSHHRGGLRYQADLCDAGASQTLQRGLDTSPLWTIACAICTRSCSGVLSGWFSVGPIECLYGRHTTRLWQHLKTSRMRGLLSGRGNTSPLPWLGTPKPGASNLGKQTGWSSIGKDGKERFHDFLQRLTLGEPKGNECRQGP